MAGYIVQLYTLLWASTTIHLSAAVPQINCTAGQPVEDKSYQLFCTGINAADKVEWRRSFQGGGGEGVIASCDDVNICTVIDSTQHEVSRPTGSTSSLTILRVQRNDDARWTWTCLSGGQYSSCNLPPTIYPPELSTDCTAELTLGGPVARCVIQKVYPVPECTWLESINSSNGAGESNTTILQSSSEVQFETLASFRTADGNLYFSATCVLRRNVTYIEGNYSYTAVISPGSSRQVVQFVGRSSVTTPSTPALVDCTSGYIPPTQEVVCTCRVTDLGWPQGHVMWTDQSGNVIRTGLNYSVQLVRGDLPEPKSLNRTYTCQVRSSDNFKHTADYVPLFAFGPDAVRITGPNNLIPDDNSPVTLACTAFRVNPQPVFIWQVQGPAFQKSGSVSGGAEALSYQESISFVPGLTEKSVVVTCFVRNSQFNLSYLSNASFTIPFIQKNCSYSGGASAIQGTSSQDVVIVGATLGAICAVQFLILVCIGVIWCGRRKQNRKQKAYAPAKEKTVDARIPLNEIDRSTASERHEGQSSARHQGPRSVGNPRDHRSTRGQGDQTLSDSTYVSYEHLYDTADEGNKNVYRQLDRGYVDMTATAQAPSGGVRQTATAAQPQGSSAPASQGGQGGQRPDLATPAPTGPPDNLAETSSPANDHTYIIPCHSGVYVGPDSAPGVNSNQAALPPLPPLPKLPLPQPCTEASNPTSNEHRATAASELPANCDRPPRRPGAQPEGSVQADFSLDNSSMHQTLPKST